MVVSSGKRRAANSSGVIAAFAASFSTFLFCVLVKFPGCFPFNFLATVCGSTVGAISCEGSVGAGGGFGSGAGGGFGSMCRGAAGGFGSMCRGAAGGFGSMCRGAAGGVGSGAGVGAGAGDGAGAVAGTGSGSAFPLRPFVIVMYFFSIFFLALVCLEPGILAGGCIACISGAGCTGSYLGADAGINGTDGGPGFGPGFGPPLFPLGESILYVSGCFDFLVLILSTSILT